MKQTAAASLLTLAAWCSLSQPVLAAPAGTGPTHSLGLYVSNIAGSGLTYVLDNGPSGMGFHVSGIGWGQGSSSFLNVGAALTKSLTRQEWGSLYALGAVGLGAGSAQAAPEANFAPGVGIQLGIFRAELAYSVYTNSKGTGFTPAGGFGMFVSF